MKPPKIYGSDWIEFSDSAFRIFYFYRMFNEHGSELKKIEINGGFIYKYKGELIW